MKPIVLYSLTLAVACLTAFAVPSHEGVARPSQRVEDIPHVVDSPTVDSAEAARVMREAAELSERLADKSKELNNVLEKAQQKAQENVKDAQTLRKVIAEKKDTDKPETVKASATPVSPAPTIAPDMDTSKALEKGNWFQRVFRW